MKKRMIPIVCPHCGHTFQINRDTLALVNIDDVAYHRLLNRTYFSHQCSMCHFVFPMVYPFMARDANKKFSVILSDQKDFGYFDEEETVVVVKNVNSFYFVFSVFEKELNLNLVVSKKKQLEEKLQQEVYFDTYDKKNHCLWFQCGLEYKAVVLNNEEVKRIQK